MDCTQRRPFSLHPLTVPSQIRSTPFPGSYTQKGRPKRIVPSEGKLAAQAEPADNGAVTLDVLLHQVVEKAAALADHHQQAAPAVMVLLVRLEVVRQLKDARGQQRDLHLGGACI